MIEQVKPNLYVKKRGDSYRVVYPVKKDLTQPWSLQNCNWKNLILGGSWWNFLTTMFILGLLLFIIYAYKHDTALCREVLQNPLQYCGDIILDNLRPL